MEKSSRPDGTVLTNPKILPKFNKSKQKELTMQSPKFHLHHLLFEKDVGA